MRATERANASVLPGFIGLLAAMSIAGCGDRTGPTLPPDVGTDHVGGGEEPEARRGPEPAPEPVAIGTPVWASFHDSGFYFHGVVVERREDMHRVIYTDGASEWLPAAALLPDSLHEDARVDVRVGFGAEFQTATVGRRVGQALYVRLANGDERWTSLPHVRFQAGEDGVPGRGDPPFDAAAASGPIGSNVLVNYQLQGLRFPAIVTAQGQDGRVHVVYLDGESEWAINGTVVPDEVGPGSVVHVRRSWEPPDWVRGRVEERVGSAVRVQFDDGGVAWTTMFRVRVPMEDAPRPAEAAPAPAPEPAAPPPPRRRRR